VQIAVSPPRLTQANFPPLQNLPPDHYAITDAGQRCRTLGGGLPRAMVLGPGYAGAMGHWKDGQFLWETTLFGLNPMYYDNHFGGPYAEWSRLYGVEAPANVIATLERAVVVPGLWDTNYQHFIAESLPVIHYVCGVGALNDLPIVVHDRPYVREIIGLLYPDRQFVFLPANQFVQITDRALYITPITRNVDDLGEASQRSFRNLREQVFRAASLPEDGTPDKGKAAYYGRIVHPEHSGRTRVMVNEQELQDGLLDRGFDMRTFDGLSMIEKAKSLADTSLIVTPIGANLLNLMFAPKRLKLLVIAHPVFKNTDWFFGLFRVLGIDLQPAQTSYAVEFTDDEKPLADNRPFQLRTAEFMLQLDQLRET
jgi:capsular polysaccharide biosynthesis protein